MAQPIRVKRPVMRSVAVQKEVAAAGPDGKSRTVLLVDAAQQTGKMTFDLYTGLCVYVCAWPPSNDVFMLCYCSSFVILLPFKLTDVE